MRICIIPARGGSKRIPRKNIKEFRGKPVIAYSILAAIDSGLFDKIMVSTEDKQIAKIATQFGAEVPFFRSTVNSNDYSGTGDVMFEVISEYARENIFFDQACCIYATAPLIRKERLKEAFDLFLNGNFDVVFPAGRYGSSIFRSYQADSNGMVFMNFPEYEISRTQDLPEAYFDAGQFYWFYPEKLINLENKNIFGNIKGAVLLDEHEVQDIDQPWDWEIAELKYSYIQSKYV